ncbi:sigma-70 family RNA polymerase sigma factor [bacterium]|nr:sigma-70 family RNA polymerase sigma factor [candidate division CSSED10-310 bacterium]
MNELVAKAGRGDVKAQEELFQYLQPRLDRIVRKYAWINGVETDDLRQEAYVAVMEGLLRVDTSIGSSSEYLLKFARWRLLDCLKKIRRRREDAVDDIENEACEAGPIPDTEMLEHRLNVRQRRIIGYLIQGYTWKEIGDIMGFSAANIAYHLKKIRMIYGVDEDERERQHR